MKKLLAVILCAALVLTLTACSMIGALIGGNSVVPTPVVTEDGTEIPNPMLQVADASAFEALGIGMDAPDGAQNSVYYIIDNALAQIGFTLGGYDYTYRASTTQSDISGVYDSFEDAFLLNVTSAEAAFDATVQNAAGGGRLASWSQGGVNFSLWCALAPDDAAFKACILGVMAKTFGEVSEQTAEAAQPVDFCEANMLDMDLNGDGMLEHVTFEPALDDQGYILTTDVRIVSDDGNDVAVTIEMVCGASTALAYDVDGDGLVELFISGDMCSCDYETWVLRYDDGAILSADACFIPDYEYDYLLPAAFGAVESISDGIITVSDTVDILGSWWCGTQYQMKADGFGMERVPGSIWTNMNTDYSESGYWDWVMVTSANVPVTLDGESSPTMLPADTHLSLLDTDGETYVHFITEDGTMGTLFVTFNSDSWGYSINGVNETDLFSNLPYAG